MMKQLKEGQVVFEKKQKINEISHMDGKSKKEVGIEVHSLSPAIIVKLFAAVAKFNPVPVTVTTAIFYKYLFFNYSFF